MIMRQISLLVLAFLVTISSCKNATKKTEKKDKLSTELVNNPRSAMNSDSSALQNLANMNFVDTLYDFGTINEGEIISRSFEFTNSGNSPLIISNANASCGCTVAEFPREPLAPGKKSAIKVQFTSAGKFGHQEKNITLVTNSSKGNHMLFLKGEVKAKIRTNN